ncbi:MAG: adenylate/guanylate cyclase domain-containing protein [Jiangellaceae bacterium]|nr:adenylate/guanylate cyclase domain-containing protein [Jiangellaceae bacterium]
MSAGANQLAYVSTRGRAALTFLLLLVPVGGLLLVLAVPALDLRWEHHPAHFWLVLSVAVVNVVLAVITSGAATARGDARLFLVSLALIASAGFLGLHALATPGVLLAGPNQGFNIATPVGLLLAAGLAAASATVSERQLSDRAMRWMRGALVVLIVAWAAGSVGGLGVLSGPPSTETPTALRLMAPVAIALYLFAGWCYFALYRTRRRTLPLAIAAAFVLLAEAMLAVAFGRNWQLSWWEWHLLMAVAFGAILVAARVEFRRTGSLTAAFGGLYLESTLARVDARYSAALGELVAAIRADEPLAPVLARLRADGVAADEVAVLERSARELARVDSLLSAYVGPRLAERLRQQPAMARLGGRETEVSVLFADLAGFTTFSQNRPAAEVIEMLNSYWEPIVPVVAGREGGWIERFAGDAIMVVFNAVDDQPDHPARAARAALAMRKAAAAIAAAHPDWPTFRIGIHTGRAVIGNVGADDQRSFAAIGDTTNVAARLQAAATPGQVLISQATYAELGNDVHTEALGPLALKGRAEPVPAYQLTALE